MEMPDAPVEPSPGPATADDAPAGQDLPVVAKRGWFENPPYRVYPYRYIIWRRPDRVPEAFWDYLERYRWILQGQAFLYMVGVLSWIGLCVVEFMTGMLNHFALPRIAIMGAALFVSTVASIVPMRARKAYRRKLRDADNLLCWHCGYDLRGSLQQGVCPECGRPFERAALRYQWEHWIQKS